jgi:hypothetical protein
VSARLSALERLQRVRPAPRPQQQGGLEQQASRLAWAWWLAAGVLLFAAWWLQRRGLWAALVDGDPSGISLVIVSLVGAATAWCGWRARLLALQARPHSPWRLAHRAQAAREPALAPQLLGELTHGPHETAWWFAAAALKLGLLGTVVGFIVMATQISSTGGFEIEQIQTLLQQMTRGMAIALYTTLVGLLGNLWLGLQLLLLDRQADRIAADILAEPAATSAPAAPFAGAS